MTDIEGNEIKVGQGAVLIGDEDNQLWNVRQIRKATVVLWRWRHGYRTRQVEKCVYPRQIRVTASS